jgi:hypothetical protein
MVQPPPKLNLLLRAINRERSSTSKKVEVQKPVSQVRILPGAHCRGHTAGGTRSVVWPRLMHLAEGKTKNEVIRCVKRYIAGEIFHTLQPPRPTAEIVA